MIGATLAPEQEPQQKETLDQRLARLGVVKPKETLDERMARLGVVKPPLPSPTASDPAAVASVAQLGAAPTLPVASEATAAIRSTPQRFMTPVGPPPHEGDADEHTAPPERPISEKTRQVGRAPLTQMPPLGAPQVIESMRTEATPGIRTLDPIRVTAPAPATTRPDVTATRPVPSPEAHPLTGAAKVASGAFSMAADIVGNPIHLATVMSLGIPGVFEALSAPAAFTGGRKIGQVVESAVSPEEYQQWLAAGGHEVSDKDAIDAALQLAALGLHAPLSRGTARVAQAARLPEAIGSTAAGAVARAIPGAAVGAALTSEDRTSGALIGAAAGAVHAAALGDRLPRGRRPANAGLATHPERQVGDGARPARQSTATATTLDYSEPPRSPVPEPETIDQSLAKHRADVAARTPLGAGETMQAALQRLKQAPVMGDARQGVEVPVLSPEEVARRNAPPSPLDTPEQILARVRPETMETTAPPVAAIPVENQLHTPIVQPNAATTVVTPPASVATTSPATPEAPKAEPDVPMAHLGDPEISRIVEKHKLTPIVQRIIDAHGLPPAMAERVVVDDYRRLTSGPDKMSGDDARAEIEKHLPPEKKAEPAVTAETVSKTAAVSKTPEEPKHDFSSTQLNLPPEHAKAIQALGAKIPDAALAEDGRETSPHVTVKYGLHTENADEVRALLKDQPPVTVTFGKTSVFPAGESGSGDVVKVDVDSPELHALNKRIADALPNTDTHPEYKPHATVAYVKPGEGAKYAGDESMVGQTMTLNSLTFSGKDGKTVEIPLTGKTESAPAAEAPVAPAKRIGPKLEPSTKTTVRSEPVSNIDVEPERFQFKADADEKGVGGELKSVRKWDDNLAGVIQVWRDPADGRLKNVNGHNRLGLATRLGREKINVLEIQAQDASEARTIGAMTNIAEGRGTAVDAAKLFRETGMTPDDVAAKGVSLTGAVAKDGIALANLAPHLFNEVVAGRLPVQRAAVIGRSGLEHAEQLALAKMVEQREGKGKRLTNDELSELIRFTKGAETVDLKQETLFGEESVTQSLAIEKAQLSAWIKGRLSQDKRLFGFLTKPGRAGRIGAAKVGDIDVGRAGELATGAGQMEEVYTQLSGRSGPVSTALTGAARALAQGDDPNAVRTQLYAAVSAAVEDVIGGKRPSTGGVSPTRGSAEAAGRGPDEAEAEPPAFIDPEQEGFALGEEKPGYTGEKLTGVAMRELATGRVFSQDGFEGGHRSVWDQVREETGPRGKSERDTAFEDGFITSTRPFVGRKEALEIAKASHTWNGMKRYGSKENELMSEALREPVASYNDPAQVDLFKKALANPTGPEAKALDKDEAEKAYGSVEKRDEVAKEFRPFLRKLKKAGLVSVEERKRQIGAVQEMSFIPNGTDMSTPERIGAAASIIRHPQAETLLLGYRDIETGKLLEHSISTSGQLGMVRTDPNITVKQIMDVVERLGGKDRVEPFEVHNHPSGNHVPSRADIGYARTLMTLLKVRGIRYAGHMVTDHGKATWISASYPFLDSEEITVPMADVPWKTGAETGQESLHKEKIAQLGRAVADPKSTTLIYLDSSRQGITATVVPDGTTIEEIAQQIEHERHELGASEVIIATPGANAKLVANAAKAARLVDQAWGHYVLDVLQVTPNGEHAPNVESLVNRGDYPSPDEQWQQQYERAAPLGSAFGVQRRRIGGDGPTGVPVRPAAPVLKRIGAKPAAPEMSAEYRRALEVSRQAGLAYDQVVAKYRLRDIDDATFLAARKTYDASRVAFDAAYKAEQDLGDSGTVNETDLFGNDTPVEGEKPEDAQGGLFGADAPKRSLAETERVAKLEIARLRQELSLIGRGRNIYGSPRELTNREVGRKRELLARLAPLEKLVNRDKAIGKDEAEARISAGDALFEDKAPYEGPTTGVKNAVSEAERARLGMPERPRPEPRTQEEMYDAGKAVDRADPTAIDRLLEQLKADPEKILGTVEEAGLFLKKRVDLENQMLALYKARDEAKAAGDDAAENLAKLQLADHRATVMEFTRLAEKTGTATGRALAARKMMSALDYSLSNMEAMAEHAKGAPLTDEERAAIRADYNELQEKLAAAEKDLTDAVGRAANADAARHHAELLNEALGPLMARTAKRLDKAADASDAALRAMGFRAMAGIDPVALGHLAVVGARNLARTAGKFADWSALMIKSYGKGVEPHLDEIFSASTSHLASEAGKEKVADPKKAKPATEPKAPRAQRAPKNELPETDGEEEVDVAADALSKMAKRMQKDGTQLSDLKPYLRIIALEYIGNGITGREALLSALHDDVKSEVDPFATREEVRDALSGYGQFRPLDRDADKVRLREITAESQKLAQLEALERKQAPLATGFERQSPNDETRRLEKQVNALKKELGILTDVDDATRLRSALQSAKTRTRNAIKDLQTEIDTGRRIVKGKPTLIGDAELVALKKQLADLRTVESEVFKKPGLTDEQRLALALRMMKSTVANLEERLGRARKGDFGTKAVKGQIGSPELEALRAQAKAARMEYAELKSLDPASQQEANVRANVAFRARLAQREAELLDRMAREDYSAKPPKPGAMLDDESIRRRGEMEAVKQRYRGKVQDFEKANRTAGEKARAAWVAWVRFGALSWPTVIGKLTSVAISRVVTTPMTDLVALGVANTMPGIAKIAPRWGVRSPRVALEAEAGAFVDMWMKGLKQSGQMLMNRRSQIELLHGKDTAPPELKDYMGRLHGALKEPIKEAEYRRSLIRRTSQAAINGENIYDPVTQLRLSNEAYIDAQFAVSMNKNIVSDWWNNGLRTLEKKRKEDGKRDPLGTFLATAGRTLVPISTAPTNVVLEASEYIAGLPVGGWRAAWNYMHGLEDLTPIEADSIIRQISKGLLGGAFMALVLYKMLNRKKGEDIALEPGGFYQQGEKRKKTDIPVGALRIGGRKGMTIPANLLHNPFYEAGDFAATIARVAPQQEKRFSKERKGFNNAVWAAGIGLLDETPVFGSLFDQVRDMKDPRRAADYAERMAASWAAPGAIQWVARKMDTDSAGNTIARKPVGLKQHLEYNIPGLRQKVPKRIGGR